MAGLPEDVTLGEIARGLVSLEARMGEKFNQVNRRLDTMEFVPRGEYAVQIQHLMEEIKDLQDAKRWTARTLVASFLYPVLVAAVVALVVLR